MIFCKRQGIEGHVFLVKGNQMPSPDLPQNPPAGMKTTIYVYELTGTDDVTKADRAAFYTSINTKLVKTIKSGKDGHFKVRLKPGQYSLFIKKDELFYANLFDGKNNIAPVTVTKGNFTEYNIKADYDAVY